MGYSHLRTILFPPTPKCTSLILGLRFPREQLYMSVQNSLCRKFPTPLESPVSSVSRHFNEQVHHSFCGIILTYPREQFAWHKKMVIFFYIEIPSLHEISLFNSTCQSLMCSLYYAKSQSNFEHQHLITLLSSFFLFFFYLFLEQGVFQFTVFC